MDPASPHVGNESPPSRTTILGSFLRGRPRGTSQSHIVLSPPPNPNRELSPSPPVTNTPPSPGALISTPGINHRRRPAAGAIQASVSNTTSPTTTPASGGLGISNMLRRRRSAGNVVNAAAVPGALVPTPPPPQMPLTPSTTRLPTSNTSHRIRLVPHLDSRRSLRFEAICRDLKEGDPALRIGRFTDRSGLGLAAVNALGSNKLAFKSKVVSRAHAEIWVEGGGKFMIKDTKSSSGTFLNHVRLSPANTESRSHQIKDGDILQLGVDYQGGTEDIYKSVKIRIEVGREWQAGANAFNTNALKNLKTLAIVPAVSGSGPNAATAKVLSKSNIPDCCICLFSVTIRQALFIAPCSHTFHYKCIRPLLESHHPAFSCPLCRTFADLEEDVEVEMEFEAEPEPELEIEHVDVISTSPNLAIPPVGFGPRRIDGEGEREAGAETEVEADNVRAGGPGRRARGHTMPFVDVMESGEDDAMDVSAEDGGVSQHPGSSAMVLDDEVGIAMGGQGSSPSRPYVIRSESSEGEGSGGSGGGQVANGGLGDIEGEGTGPESGDEAVGGKRKR